MQMEGKKMQCLKENEKIDLLSSLDSASWLIVK